jgi:hypothetical protein
MLKPLAQVQLNQIAAHHEIHYEILPSAPNSVATRLSKVFPQVSRSQLYREMADIGRHQRFLPHLKSLVVVTPEQLGNAIAPNQTIIVESLVEGGARLGVKLFTAFPDERLLCNLITDPFPEGAVAQPMDKKQGTIEWKFADEGSGTKMTVESNFMTTDKTVFVHELVDHVWLNFFENVMVYFGEIQPASRLTTSPG